MTKAIVVAYDRNRAIGAEGDLPWKRSLPADLAHFKKLTTGGSIIMGRKTFESIGKKPLPNRENIVLSSHPTGIAKTLTALSLDSAYALARYPVFIIGGESVYWQALDSVDVVYATEVDASFPEADTFFPSLDGSWHETSRTHHPADASNAYTFDFVEYRKDVTSQSS